MGIKGFYSHLSKKDVSPQKIDVKALARDRQTAFELDLFGTFHANIYDVMLKKYDEQSARNCGYTMATVIEKVFEASANIRIHIDGLRCSEKAPAYAERDEKRLLACSRLSGVNALCDVMFYRGSHSV
ncbi:hypothetical protein BGZ79_004830 [Entomortierella chlamydospora]|nr:hypothetical protein BGZ79_004830 [Entomortierella chlamydospora]